MGAASAPLDADAPVPAVHRHGRAGPGLAARRVGRPPGLRRLDLAAKLDLTAWALVVPDGLDGLASMVWRFWLPEAAVRFLDQRTNGRVSQWADGGWITVTPGDVIDYDMIYADIAHDCQTFKVMAAGCDKWSGEPVRQAITQTDPPGPGADPTDLSRPDLRHDRADGPNEGARPDPPRQPGRRVVLRHGRGPPPDRRRRPTPARQA